MSLPIPRVDHVSIAVPEIDRALDFFLRHFPAEMGRKKEEGYDGAFRWTNFQIGRFKIELIESARRGSFVERFLERRGPGLHHFSLDVAELDPLVEALERDGRRIVDRFDEGGGSRTAFVHPRSAFGVLVQFWQAPELAERAAPSAGGVAVKDGIRWQVDHLSLGLRSMAPAREFFERFFGARIDVPAHPGYDGTFSLCHLKLRDYRLELMETSRPGGFLERFLERRGEGMHHVSIDVEDLDATLAPFEQAGVRIVDRFTMGAGWKTAFLHPRSAFGVLIQFWQTPEFGVFGGAPG